MKLNANNKLISAAAALGALLVLSTASTEAMAQRSETDTTVIGDYPEGYDTFYKVVVVGTNNRKPEVSNESTTLGASVVIGDDNDVATGATVVGHGNRQIVRGGDTATQSMQIGRNNLSEGLGNQQLGLGNRTEGDENIVSGKGNNAAGSANQIQGNYTKTTGDYNAVIGSFNEVNANQTVAIGYMTKALRDGCVAIGSASTCSQIQEFSVGNEGYNRRITHVMQGRMNNDAATVGQLRQLAGGIGGGAGFNEVGNFNRPTINFQNGSTYNNVVDALLDLDGRPIGGGGTGADGRSAYEVAVSNGYQGDEQAWLASLKGADGRDGGGSNVVAGSNIEVVEQEDGTRSVSLSDNVELSAQGKLAIGATTVNNDGVSIQGGPSMTANGIDAGGRQITGVAPGTIAQGSMDAVNGGQLWDLENRLNDRWSDTNRRIDGLGAQLGAMSNMAMAAAANPAAVGEVQFNAGLGFSGNQAALAVGLSARLSPRVAISGGLSMGGGNKVVGGMGLSINLGR